MKNYQDKFHMTPAESLFLAKKKWDENVYCGMRMESRNITFPQTKTILQGVNVPNVQLDDIQAVLEYAGCVAVPACQHGRAPDL